MTPCSTPRVTVEPLAGMELPADSPILRDHVVDPPHRTPDYLAKYDRRTLVYDVQHDAARDRITLVAPRLLNLWPLLRDGLRIGDRPARGLRRRVFPKCEILTLPARGDPVSVALPDGRVLSARPRRIDPTPFRGTNAIVTMSRDNPLDWIADWLRFYVRAHSADGVLFIDNGSTAYAPERLADTIAAVSGLRRAAILTAPRAYGPLIAGQHARIKPNFLKSAMLNMARVGPLAQARAVLNADVDELVQGPPGASLFDAAQRAWHGTLNIGGTFAFPAPGTDDPAPQRAHVWQAEPPRISTRKWAARPGGLLSRMGWFVHQVGGEPFRLVPESRHFRLVHCAAANLNWFRGKDSAVAAALRHDRALQDMMDRVFDD
ncbi:hypothetical protein ACVDG3_08890 [Meridianimarinicoccus sp. RP-17]|uniref:hypothetical protein n=1 Tax=Meridianimarinicoccus zhengii TaxID=2056810 RepID=UPI000DADCFF2|nr:hypothetical protein [Phycocomes zhengii]